MKGGVCLHHIRQDRKGKALGLSMLMATRLLYTEPPGPAGLDEQERSVARNVIYGCLK
jgi:hypothetical protein